MRQADIKIGGEYLTKYDGKALVGKVERVHPANDNRRRRYDLRIHPLPGGAGIVVSRLANAIEPTRSAEAENDAACFSEAYAGKPAGRAEPLDDGLKR